MDFFWNIFKESGNIEAYLGYKNAQKLDKNKYNQNKKNNNYNKDIGNF